LAFYDSMFMIYDVYGKGRDDWFMEMTWAKEGITRVLENLLPILYKVKKVI